jgi:hypothetical protein
MQGTAGRRRARCSGTRTTSPSASTARVGRAVGPFYLAVDERDTVYVSEFAGARRVLMIPRVGRTRVLVG